MKFPAAIIAVALLALAKGAAGQSPAVPPVQPPPAAPDTTPAAPEQAVDEDPDGIHAFVTEYFSSWSENSFVRYGACFDPAGTIALLGAHNQVRTWRSAEFVAEQRAFQARGPKVEIPTKITIEALTERSAFVNVQWRLTRAPDEFEFGTDWFHLIRSHKGGKWKIIYLSFWSHPEPEEE